MKCIEARAVRWPEVWDCNFGLEAANDAQNVEEKKGKKNY